MQGPGFNPQARGKGAEFRKAKERLGRVEIMNMLGLQTTQHTVYSEVESKKKGVRGGRVQAGERSQLHSL